MKVFEVCELTEFNDTTTVVANCEYLPYTSGLLPYLSVSDALILSSAVWGLLSLAFIFRNLRNVV